MTACDHCNLHRRVHGDVQRLELLFSDLHKNLSTRPLSCGNAKGSASGARGLDSCHSHALALKAQDSNEPGSEGGSTRKEGGGVGGASLAQ